jgi:hypothetical protein
MQKYSYELKLLEQCNMSQKRKIKLIENLYRLAHINFNNFIENDWEIIF